MPLVIFSFEQYFMGHDVTDLIVRARYGDFSLARVRSNMRTRKMCVKIIRGRACNGGRHFVRHGLRFMGLRIYSSI